MSTDFCGVISCARIPICVIGGLCSKVCSCGQVVITGLWFHAVWQEPTPATIHQHIFISRKIRILPRLANIPACNSVAQSCMLLGFLKVYCCFHLHQQCSRAIHDGCCRQMLAVMELIRFRRTQIMLYLSMGAAVAPGLCDYLPWLCCLVHWSWGQRRYHCLVPQVVALMYMGL